MTSLDSRALTSLDCFGQKFDTAGTVRYTVGGPLAACLRSDDLPFTITVEDGTLPEPQQFDVEVQYDGNYAVHPRNLSIHAGDVVVWHCTSSSSPPYAIWGDDKKGELFSSLSLRNDCFYSHPFGSPGKYEWVDANKGVVGGVINVRDLDGTDEHQCEQWVKILQEGALVLIKQDTAEPATVDVVTGQTVFFAVANSTGLTVTDATLQPPGRH